MTRKPGCASIDANLSHQPCHYGADCVICTRAEPDDPDALKIIQVIEFLEYHRVERTVRVRLLLAVVNNEKSRPLQLRIVHPGMVTGEMKKFEISSPDPRQQLLRELYGTRFRDVEDTSDAVDFFARENCTGVADIPERYSTLGPGSCFACEGSNIQLEPEKISVTETGPDVPFTSFRLRAMQPEERSAFLVDLTLSGDAYDNLVREVFSVDSYTRLKRDIETFSLDEKRCPDHVKFYDRYIRAPETTISPKTYDIVILQKFGDPVSVERGSSFITPIRTANPELNAKVLWFLGQPSEFYLMLTYAREGVQNARRPMGILVDWADGAALAQNALS
jgi:hypothetical protein